MKSMLTLSFLILASCSNDTCREYSEFTCDEISKANYNVYFYYPGGNEQYLGKSNGLDSCGSIASSFAYQKELSASSEWTYVCCMIANGSECYEKHR